MLERARQINWSRLKRWTPGIYMPRPAAGPAEVIGRYAIALGCTALAFWVRLLLDPMLQHDYPFTTFLLALIAVNWWCGTGPALLVLALGLPAGMWFLISLHHPLLVQEPAHWIGLAIYALVGLVLIWLGWLVRQTHSELEAQVRQAASSRERLAHEIEDRKQAEAAVRQSEAEFRTAFQLSAAGQAQADPVDGQLLRVNSRYCEMTGYSEQELLQMGFVQLVHPEDRERCWAGFQRVVRGEVPYTEIEERYVHKNGQPFNVCISAAMIRDAEGRPLRVTAVVEDISARKRLEQELRRREEQSRRYAEELEARVAERTGDLQQSLKSMQDFTYTIAHDLRAPLRATHSFATLLAEHHAAALGQEGREFARRITEAAEHMDRLIHDLLEYGRIVSAETPLHPVQIEPLIENAIQEVQSLSAGAGARIEVAHPLPPVCANDALLGKALVQLLDNAVKFVAPGVTPRIQIRAEPRNGWIRLCVQDNGIGIDPEFHGEIFRTFQRLAPGQHEGTGMGLALVQKAVERMRGRVGLDSRPGQGSCFWIELPRAAK